MKTKTKIIALSGVSLLVLAGLTVGSAWLFGEAAYSQICPVCGRTRDVQENRVPGTMQALRHKAKMQDTTMTEVLVAFNLAQETGHHWLRIQGPVPGGDGQPFVPVYHDTNTADFINLVFRYGDAKTTEKWLARLRDPLRTAAVRRAGEVWNDDRTNLSKRDPLNAWLKEWGDAFFDVLEAPSANP
jgi:hypothetical protein